MFSGSLWWGQGRLCVWVWVDGFAGWMEKALGIPTLKTKSINRACFLLPGSHPLESVHTCISEFGVLLTVVCILQAVPCSPLQKDRCCLSARALRWEILVPGLPFICWFTPRNSLCLGLTFLSSKRPILIGGFRE